jgi:hypothetical protein
LFPIREATRCANNLVLDVLLDLFEVAPVNRPVLEQAAMLVGASAIATRNTKDFKKSIITVLDPAELLSTIHAMESDKKSKKGRS